jgi:hypothetical protein
LAAVAVPELPDEVEVVGVELEQAAANVSAAAKEARTPSRIVGFMDTSCS